MEIINVLEVTTEVLGFYRKQYSIIETPDFDVNKYIEERRKGFLGDILKSAKIISRDDFLKMKIEDLQYTSIYEFIKIIKSE